jgi:signal transduction histidine kinase
MQHPCRLHMGLAQALLYEHKDRGIAERGEIGASVASDDEKRPSTALELKEAFIALISDDLLTPLAAIKTGAELMQKLGHLGPQTHLVQQCVTSILQSTTRLTSMVDDLLDISRIEDGSFPIAARPISLRDFLPDLLAHLALPLDGRRLELSLDEGLPLAWADPDLLERVFRNLLTAAIRHSPSGSPIVVQAGAPNGVIRVSVIDRGAGISAEDLPRALDNLRRAPAGGLGLCLYITKRAVEALGGRIEVASELGLGSTFSFTLPSVDGAAAASTGHGPRAPGPHDNDRGSRR